MKIVGFGPGAGAGGCGEGLGLGARGRWAALFKMYNTYCNLFMLLAIVAGCVLLVLCWWWFVLVVCFCCLVMAHMEAALGNMDAALAIMPWRTWARPPQI